ncbi:HEAT repeat-containing protein [Terrimicrobium sacchariphilum]|uniref:HEAT repeat-containing protein n=1 Tax=Terrimicrobium sacchariphilum TaxID=690879 RepID=A0A146G3S6_TERSA|nr:HEAT repeat domain-containing protein [Terrimicrobium sacchariphilum]GAT32479.1 HEAT repeat-containing protein [Terrimicrobium sacchariphilum]
MTARCVLPLVVAFACLWPGVAGAYKVGRAVPLEGVAAKADVIFKATAVSEARTDQGGFEKVPGFAPVETRLRMVSVLKGDVPKGEVGFLHYDVQDGELFCDYEPQHYRLVPGKTYLVFALRQAWNDPALFRQIWMSHTGLKTQGELLCADDQPLASTDVREIYWKELTGLLHSSDPAEVVYAIEMLDKLGGDGRETYDQLKEFPREKVIDAVKPLITSKDPAIARAALMVVGGGNPYMTEERAAFWLATIGVETPGLGRMDPGLKNPGAERYAQDLIALADGSGPEETRALAILALGLTRNPAVQPALERWLTDPSPRVRAAAVVLLADYPAMATGQRLRTAATDPAAEVRSAAARAVGFGQYIDHAGLLADLLKDPDRKVRHDASVSLLSFPPEKESIAAIFRANLGTAEFAPLFLLALAAKDPSPYRDALADVVVKEISPTNWSGGQIPSYTARALLLRDLKAQSPEDLRSGRFDHALDALGTFRKGGGSSPVEVYALYFQKGLTDRAKALRAQATAEAGYDIGSQFDAAAAHPDAYLGN